MLTRLVVMLVGASMVMALGIIAVMHPALTSNVAALARPGMFMY